MSKTRKFALFALAFTVVGSYHLFTFFHNNQTGCIPFRAHLTCRYQNVENFQNLQNLELFFACAWLAAAVLCWMTAAQARKERA
ncbi:hypothetical protein [Burkholderia oklahomensis]|uniref:Uncharacterized protein n=2 Tax=Burkholderia oklahomensis TaxID=342113 RepID=A0AAI8FR17_9BURK|nr:hypothetical protein [Burkholderia oklahomensis]AIO69462.1 hypothetical protein DM82_5458 [Burkholderia oklahomensis]AJX34779.1 hypothetical protein BG90_5151 [Burkholderia oklahomensis C6786]SUY27077.1 Uncharacterised protein [Burkholderia oklahomensis]